MTLDLDAPKLVELERLISILLSPLDHLDEEAWLDAVNGGVAALFDADGGLATVPGPGGEPLFRFRGVEPDVAATLQEIAVGTGRGTLRFRYPGLDRMMRRLAAAGITVWTPELAGRLTGLRIEELAFTREVAVPAGIAHQANLAVPLLEGMALLAFYHDSPERDPFGEDRIPLLQLLRPAFRSGVRDLFVFREGQAALETHFAAQGTALLAFGTGGQPLHRNPAADALFTGGRRRELLREASEMAATLATGPNVPGEEGARSHQGAGTREVTEGDERYRLSASLFPRGSFRREAAVLVRVERLTAALPTVEEIRARTALTPRQAEVALLIARDLTSAEIAERLGISVHTVRRHVERILPRLGVRSRKGIAARLLASRP